MDDRKLVETVRWNLVAYAIPFDDRRGRRLGFSEANALYLGEVGRVPEK